MSLYLGENLVSGVATPIQGARNIGQIIASALPLTDAGLHLLDGALIDGSGIYSAFVTYIAGLVSTYPDLFETEANWQTAVTNYGVCGKFVYDSTNNTVRLPKITGIIEGTTDVTALGDLVEAGLPNITGSNFGRNAAASFSGACVAGTSTTYAGYSSYNGNHTDFDASLSNPIYGNSSTVQPQTIKAFYYIVIATITKTDIEVDIDEIVTDLNGKVNTSELTECTVVTEAYQNGSSWYRIYSDGWCEQGGQVSANIGTSDTSWTVTFLKPFLNTNYVVQTSVYGGWAADNRANVETKATTQMSGYAKSSNASTRYIQWVVFGYIGV